MPTADSLFNLANCNYALGNHDEAVKHWNKSLEIKKSPDAYVNLANVYATVFKKSGDAIKYYEKALQLSPYDGEIHYNYAVTLEFAFKFKEAIVHYQKAMDFGIDKEAVNKNLLNVYSKLAGSKCEFDSKNRDRNDNESS